MGRLKSQWEMDKFLTISVDPWPALMPESATSVMDFLRKIIDATRDLCCCYQINPRFYYDHFGDSAHSRVRLVAEHMRQKAPLVPIIVDIKEADISAAIACSARFWFEQMNFDAVTVCPFYGMDAFWPFLRHDNKGVVVNCRTSNPDAGEFQDLEVKENGGEPMPLHRFIAWRASQHWNKVRNCALTIDASHPEDLGQTRSLITQAGEPTIPIFIYGSGTQGTRDALENISQSVSNGQDLQGRGFSIVVSRTVLYASRGSNFADEARASAIRLIEAIRQSRKSTA